MNILAIDPGTTQSALVAKYDGKVVGQILPNDEALTFIHDLLPHAIDVVVIEQIESFGMPVGRTVFQTVHWAGRFFEAAESKGKKAEQLPRKEVKIALCGSLKAKDPNIRAALIDMYGGSKEAAVGLKKAPGPLYGFKADMWAALGVLEAYLLREVNGEVA